MNSIKSFVFNRYAVSRILIVVLGFCSFSTHVAMGAWSGPCRKGNVEWERKKQNAFFSAIARGDEESVRGSIKGGIYVNRPHLDRHDVPLGWASWHGQKRIVDVLLELRADVTQEDWGVSGRLPLHIAAYRGHPTIVAALLKAHAEPDAIWKSCNKTALHMAADNPCAETIQLLIEAKAEVNPMDDRGRTPLDLAIDADWNCRDQEKKSQYADWIALLRAFGAITGEEEMARRRDALAGAVDISHDGSENKPGALGQ